MKGYASSVCTASGVVKAGPGRVVSVVLAGGADASTLILYDHASAASGTELLRLSAVAAGSAAVSFGEEAILAATGIYAALTGTAPVATVQFE